MSGTELVVSESMEELAALSTVQDSPYWEGPRSRAMQMKYADDLAKRDNLPSPYEREAPSAHAIVNRIYDTLTEEDRWPLADSFSRLPSGAQQAIAHELSLPLSLTSVSSDMMLVDGVTVGEAVAEFISRPEGEEFAEQWGGAVERKVSTLYVRIARALASMNANDQILAAEFVGRLSLSQVVAITGALTK